MGKIEDQLLRRIRSEGTIHLTLIDPEETTPKMAAKLAKIVEDYGTAAIMVGGSTLVLTAQIDRVVKSIKSAVNIPVILFPSNVSSISRYADAIWFMSLLNSNNPIFITGLQALGAPIVRRYGLEAIPMAYLIVGDGSTAAYIGQAHAIPMNKPDVAALYSLAAQYLGMRFVYLEAGSGAKEHVPCDIVRTVVRNVEIPVIVGGGIRTPEEAKKIAEAGASAIVTGTVCETDPSGESVKRIIEGIAQVNNLKHHNTTVPAVF